MIRRSSFQILDRMKKRFALLYDPELTDDCLERISMLTGRYGIGLYDEDGYPYWDQADIYLITYADIVRKEGEAPIKTLHAFLKQHLRGAINTVHLLPFFPSSSDDGFAVIDYRRVDPELGDWPDVETLGRDFSLVFDLVLNHASRQSKWFRHYTKNIAPERSYFIEADPHSELSAVVRPRSLPLLTEVKTKNGPRHLWTTFSPDQIDLNFADPNVLFEFLDILMQYISHGARVIRLDAVAYLWKKLGTRCIHLRETHEVVKLIRDFLEMNAPAVTLLTETNVPHADNISYFGAGDESQIVYQFSLPPLLLHALLNGDASHLARWAAALAPPPPGCTFLNFSASHDGIGLLPLDGLVPPEEVAALARHVEERGGQVSHRSNPDGSRSPYELNISYFDALGFTGEAAGRQEARFLCSQTIPLALRGLPAVYFHSLTATPNYLEGVAETGRARTINRRKWKLSELEALLDARDSPTRRVFQEYVRRLRLRSHFKAFHPDGDQQVLDLGPSVFAVLRSSPDGLERVLSLNNCSADEQHLTLPRQTAVLNETDQLHDRIADEDLPSPKKIALAPYQSRWIPLTPIAN